MLGQLTPMSSWIDPPPTVCDCHEDPPFVVRVTTPPTPTPMQVDVLAQLSPNTPKAGACRLQEAPPLVVARICPPSPAAKQTEAVEQLMATRALPSGSGFCQFQAPPAEIDCASGTLAVDLEVDGVGADGLVEPCGAVAACTGDTVRAARQAPITNMVMLFFKGMYLRSPRDNDDG